MTDEKLNEKAREVAEFAIMNYKASEEARKLLCTVIENAYIAGFRAGEVEGASSKAKLEVVDG